MAVLIEAISVVIRCRSIVEKLSGGVEEFLKSLPNKTLRSDGELACVHFMNPSDTKSYVASLIERGLIYKDPNGVAIDIVVVDQKRGPMVPCDWIDFGCTDWDNDPRQQIAVCCARPTRSPGVVAPEGWSYEGSLTANSRFVESDDMPSSLEFLHHEDGVDVFRDKETGQEYFARTR